MKIWVNSSELSGVSKDEFVFLHYAEEPAEENPILGSVTKHPGKLPNWFLADGKTGKSESIELAKRMVETRAN